LLPRVRLHDDPELRAYLVALGETLIDGMTPSFHVVLDPTLNLFALPTGDVFVHTGVLAAVGSEVELTALLARELAHVRRRDALEEGPPENPQPSLRAGAATSPTAEAIFAQRLALTARAAITGYGGWREFRTDAAVVTVLTRAGQDLRAAPAALARLAARVPEGDSREVFLLGNRQWLEERIDSMEQLASAARATPAAVYRAQPGETFARVVRAAVRENAYEEVRQGRFATARRQLERVTAGTPDDARAQLYYGDLYRLQAQRAASPPEREVDLVQARAAYERALQLDPSLVEAHRQLGLLYYAMSDLARARAELERYLALAPSAPDARRIGEYVMELAR
jgi:predicted Zn-dependent protease